MNFDFSQDNLDLSTLTEDQLRHYFRLHLFVLTKTQTNKANSPIPAIPYILQNNQALNIAHNLIAHIATRFALPDDQAFLNWLCPQQQEKLND